MKKEKKKFEIEREIEIGDSEKKMQYLISYLQLNNYINIYTMLRQ